MKRLLGGMDDAAFTGEWRLLVGDKVLFADEIQRILSDAIHPLLPADDQPASAPAADFVFADGLGRIGFISSISRPFCESCNRVRLTADGKFRNCLFSLEETDLRPLLREGGTDDEIRATVRGSVDAKWEGHEINTAHFIQPARAMHSIGG